MQNQNHHDLSIPHIRLSHPLPPLPQDLPLQILMPPPQLSISTQTLHRDDPIESVPLAGHLPSQPPKYEPMHDYLRSHRRTISYPNHPRCPRRSPTQPIPQESYRDEPFVVTIVENDPSQPPPPSYNELYRQNELELQTLSEETYTYGTPAEQAEALVKWVVAMLLIGLTIAALGMALNWGGPN